MNKLILINMIQKIFEQYTNNTLTNETLKECIDNTPFVKLETEKTQYLETQFLCTVFEKIPYYRICDYTCEFISYISKLAKGDEKCSSITNLIGSYISDMFCNIDSRISTELLAHIHELMLIYYQTETLDYELCMSRLKRQIIPAHYIVSMESAESSLYIQEKMPGFEENNLSLRDKISKNNFNKKASTERSLKKQIIKFFNADSFEAFITALEKNVKKYHEEDPIDADILHDYLYPVLQKLYSYAIGEWEKLRQKSEEPSDQYKLIFN